MYSPITTFTCLATGVIVISAASKTFYKIYHGSKSEFAYTLITFTMIDGVVNFANFFICAFPHTIYIGGQEKNVVNIFAYQTTHYLYFLGTLQTWIFAMQYWNSATSCSLTTTLISAQTISLIKWSGIILYTSVLLAMYIWSLVTFPEYVSDGQYD